MGPVVRLEHTVTAGAVGLVALAGPDIVHAVVVASLWLVAQVVLHEYRLRRPLPKETPS